MEKIKVGIFGLGRGSSGINDLLLNGAEIVALCDKDETRLKSAEEKLENAAAYTDFDEFINHKGLEAIYICNYFSDHARFAIKALEKNIHVLSEGLSNVTMAEGVALVRAFRKSEALYMLYENYPFKTFSREIKRVCDEGSLGKLLFAEGEYNHPFTPGENWYHKPFATHWRNLIPATYYITHSLMPLIYFTGAKPKRVTAMPVFSEYSKEEHFNGIFNHDRASMMTTLNDDDSVFRFAAWSTFGGMNNHYRVCGTKGQVENIAGTDGMIMLKYNKWELPEGMEENNYYKPELNDKDEENIEKSGHGGGDYITVREFLSCIRENRKPVFDVYLATLCSSVAILGHRSQMENGVPYDIPDFHKKEDLEKYENDNLNPFYSPNGDEPTERSSSRPIEINREKIANYDSEREKLIKELRKNKKS